MSGREVLLDAGKSKIISDRDHAFPYSTDRKEKMKVLGALLRDNPDIGAKLIVHLLETRQQWSNVSGQCGLAVAIEVERQIDTAIEKLKSKDQECRVY
jgi:hypothetical protein